MSQAELDEKAAAAAKTAAALAAARREAEAGAEEIAGLRAALQSRVSVWLARWGTMRFWLDRRGCVRDVVLLSKAIGDLAVARVLRLLGCLLSAALPREVLVYQLKIQSNPMAQNL